MTTAIAPEKMAEYLAGARRREARLREDGERRRHDAWEVARRASSLLKTDYGATQVIVFGSLAHGAWYNARSDIDLAVAGVAPEAFWRAWRALDRLDSRYRIDLVAIESLTEPLKTVVHEEGIEL